MKIAGFSDTHLPGTGVPGAAQAQWRQEDFLKAFRTVVEQIWDYNPDLILFAGDAFQSRSPSPRWVIEFLGGLKRLSEDAAPVVVIPGNHDLTGWGSLLEILNTLDLDVAGIHYMGKPGAVEVRGIQVFGMPWISGKYISARDGTADRDAINREMEKLARTGIQAFLAQPHDGPRIFLGHLIMLGGSFGGFAPVTLGHEIFWQGSWLDGFDAALLGHLHCHQFPDPSRPHICYAGSTERLNFGERDEAKGWVSINLSDEKPEWEFHPIPVRPMVQIEMEAKGTEIAFPDVPEDAILKVILRLKAGQSAPEIRVSCRHLLPPIFLWEGEERQFRGPDGLTEMGMMDQLTLYWESRGIPPAQIEVFMEYAEEIISG